MTPFFGGISLIVFVLIRIMAWAVEFVRDAFHVPQRRWAPPKPHFIISALIIGGLGSFYLTVYSQVLDYAVNDPENNFARAYYALFNTCTPLPAAFPQDKKVILRLDDVQANGWTDISIKMMDDARAYNMPVVAGVIPHQLNTDLRIVHFLKRFGCTVEVAIHGYKHGLGEEGARGIGEFSRLSHDDALLLTRKAQSELSNVTKTRPVTFIPPNNAISQEAVEAVNFLGMPIMSSGDKDAYGFDTSTDKATTSPGTAYGVMDACDQRWESNDPLCVIMLHPQDFSNADHELEPSRYRMYTELLRMLDERSDVQVTTFRDFYEEQSVPANSTPGA